MSDEQKMPEVIYAGILDASEMSSPFNGSDKPYLRCDIEPEDAVVVSREYLAEMQAKVARLTSRGIENMHHTIATLTAERDALRELIRRARSDIFQTARSNQCNLTGKDISFLHDAAQPERIGKTPVHQSGITESLSLVKEIDAALAQLKEQDDA